MDNRDFLHDGETLLCSQRASAALFVRSAVRGLFDGVILGLIVSALIGGIAYFAFNTLLPVWVFVLLFVVSYLIILWKRWQVWKHETFRVTSERLLVPFPAALFHAPLHTIKWSQYQESHVGHRGVLDFFFLSRPLCIRHGTADAHKETCFPSLSYAQDLKHYLDKVDSAVRAGTIATVKPFVAKPRGRRDMEV